MNCMNTRRLLSAYIDSELSPDEMSDIRNHLFKCDECGREHRELLAAKGDLSILRAEEPSEELLRFIACKPWETGMAHPLSSKRFPNRKSLVSGFAAAAIFIISLGISLNSFGLSRTSPREDLAKSFQSEHNRLGYGSPLSGSPDTVSLAQIDPTDDIRPDSGSSDDDRGDGWDGSTDTDSVTASDNAFVTFVSHSTVE